MSKVSDFCVSEIPGLYKHLLDSVKIQLESLSADYSINKYMYHSLVNLIVMYSCMYRGITHRETPRNQSAIEDLVRFADASRSLLHELAVTCVVILMGSGK